MTNYLHGVLFCVDSSSRWRQSRIANNKGLFWFKKMFVGSFPNICLHGDNNHFPDGILMKAYLSFAKIGLKFYKGDTLFWCSPSIIHFSKKTLLHVTYFWGKPLTFVNASSVFRKNNARPKWCFLQHNVNVINGVWNIWL